MSEVYGHRTTDVQHRYRDLAGSSGATAMREDERMGGYYMTAYIQELGRCITGPGILAGVLSRLRLTSRPGYIHEVEKVVPSHQLKTFRAEVQFWIDYARYRAALDLLRVFMVNSFFRCLTPDSCGVQQVYSGMYIILGDNYQSPIYCLELMMSTKAGFKLAPPTRKPSMSGCLLSSLQFFSLTLPP